MRVSWLFDHLLLVVAGGRGVADGLLEFRWLSKWAVFSWQPRFERENDMGEEYRRDSE